MAQINDPRRGGFFKPRDFTSQNRGGGLAAGLAQGIQSGLQIRAQINNDKRLDMEQDKVNKALDKQSRRQAIDKSGATVNEKAAAHMRNSDGAAAKAVLDVERGINTLESAEATSTLDAYTKISTQDDVTGAMYLQNNWKKIPGMTEDMANKAVPLATARELSKRQSKISPKSTAANTDDVESMQGLFEQQDVGTGFAGIMGLGGEFASDADMNQAARSGAAMAKLLDLTDVNMDRGTAEAKALQMVAAATDSEGKFHPEAMAAARARLELLANPVPGSPSAKAVEIAKGLGDKMTTAQRAEWDRRYPNYPLENYMGSDEDEIKEVLATTEAAQKERNILTLNANADVSDPDQFTSEGKRKSPIGLGERSQKKR